jgi:Ca-activated chloride channel family protein
MLKATCILVPSVAILVLNLVLWSLGLVSDFGFRISDFPSRGSLSQDWPVERRTWEKQLPFDASGEIEVENPQGRILIREGTPGQVHFVADGGSAPVLTDDLKINTKRSRLTIKCASKDRPRTLDFYLTVPPGVRLRLKAEEGTVQVHARVSGVRVETLSGDVVLNVPVDDLKIDVTWREGYVRYGGPELQRVTAPASTLSTQRGPAPPPATLTGQIGEGRVRLSVNTLNGWVEIGHQSSNRVIIGAAPAQPLSRAAQTLARHQQSLLSTAIRTIEPRLESVLELSDAPSASKPEADEDDVVKLESPLVNLNASITDAEGKVMSGLTAKDFTVSEDGVRQQITHFATETTSFNLVLLLDVSGSTSGKIELIKQAATRFVDLMHPNDKIAVFLFARDVEVVAPLMSDREQLRQAIAQVQPPHGSTALYDAIGYALVEGLGRVGGERNAIVVITDGHDSSMAYAGTPLANDPMRRPGSFLRFNDLLAGLLQSDVLIYPIVIDNQSELASVLIEQARQQVEAQSRLAEEQLKQLADASGGRLYRAARLEGLKSVYEQIASDLRTIYSLAYMPTRTGCDGCWRRVEINVARPGARIRCRRGYLAR